MSFGITISGHGPKEATVRKVFERAIRDLRAELGGQEPGWAEPSVAGSWWTGNAEGSAKGTAEEVDADKPSEAQP
jgi:hypothetical protein